MKITAIILASGSSKRMGKDKLTLTYKDKRIFEYVIDLVSKFPFDEKIIITNNNEIINYAKIKGILNYKNPRHEIGKSESIKIGIENSKRENDYMFFVSDQPLLRIKTVKKILYHFSKNPELITYPMYEGHRGSPVIFPNKYKMELLKLTEDMGGASIIDEVNSQGVLIDNCVENIDIDNQEDYSRILKYG